MESNSNSDEPQNAAEIPTNIRPLELYKLGIGLHESGQYDAAIDAYTQALATLPQFESIYFHRAMSYEAQQDYQRAIADLDKFIQYSPYQDYFNHIYRARLYKALRDYDSALTDYGTALHLNPSSWDAYFEKGELEFELSHYETALSDLSTAIQLSPGLLKGLRLRGLAYMRQGNYNAALDDFMQTIHIVESEHYTLLASDFYNRGLAFAATNQRENALSDYKRTTEIDPHSIHLDEINRYIGKGAE